VFLDDGFGARVDRRMVEKRDSDTGAVGCAHCGGATTWIYRRSFRGPPVGREPTVRLEEWRELGFCTLLCCEYAIKNGKMDLPSSRGSRS
jgi:hypothetical protein